MVVLRDDFDAVAAARRVKLICLDLDGTLLASDKTVPERNAAAIRAAARAGLTIAVASGRHPFNVRELMEELDLPFHAVCLSGAVAFREGAEVFRHPLSFDSVDRAIDIARACGSYISVASTDFNYMCGGVDRGNDASTSAVSRYHGFGSYDDLCEAARAHAGELLKCALHADGDREYKALRLALDALPGVEVAQSDVHWVDLTASGCSKLEGIRALASAFGFALDEVAAMGDDENDVTSLGAVGFGVAMGNALPSARAAAAMETAANDACGVAEAIDFILWAQGGAKEERTCC